MSENGKKILFAGLPECGKTTFIAAFWYHVNNSANDKSVSLDTLAAGDIEYLNKISGEWASCCPVTRTLRTHKAEKVKMQLKRTDTNDKFILEIPDFAGEIYKRHFEFRQWNMEYDEIVEEGNGVVLFVDPRANNLRPFFIADENNLLGKIGEKVPAMSANSEKWVHDFVPDQVKLVEALQFIAYRKELKAPLKVAYVISAWDKIKSADSAEEPENWLKNNLPLLYQYTICNSDIFNVNYYGVSAQGGDYEQDSERLLEMNPFDRIIVMDESGTSKDIARPLLWITG
jgi:hypothetical protein